MVRPGVPKEIGTGGQGTARKRPTEPKNQYVSLMEGLERKRWKVHLEIMVGAMGGSVHTKKFIVGLYHLWRT